LVVFSVYHTHILNLIKEKRILFYIHIFLVLLLVFGECCE